ncbi:SseB family protein [Litorihabitans aurantiacus]|uniref:SseB protein N-terminal domain-containing protein n=1 Tax=Litorihabitans aurantiacus TaxID=1930061 RepID=A0AA38CSR1_9MICO|nr:SseB family protein [Litorihabitans aurantiacus]GMA31689.1 hypothetical protein GCM10025875_16810 [Litorihabitans aurantiacus]
MPIGDFLPRTGEQRAPRELPPTSAFAGDDGTCPPLLAAALALPVGASRTTAVVRALASERVLVPVVAHEETEHDADVRERLTGHREPASGTRVSGATAHAGAEARGHTGGTGRGETAPGAEARDHVHGGGCDHGGDDDAFREARQASAALVTVRTPDGREALPIFSSVRAMAAWRRDARPVPHEGARTALAAVEEAAGVLVLDPGADEPVLVPRPAVWAIARGEEWVPALEDPAVAAAVAEAVGGVDGVRRTAVLAGGRAEVKVELAVVPGLTREEVQVVAQRAAQALAESVVVAERVDSLELALTTA